METANHKFEGPEKKIEIILSKPVKGLMDNSGNRWGMVAEASRARIISKIASPFAVAFLLSESSLFVWEDRILMITCGKTRLIDAFPLLLEIIGRQSVAMVFYERKNLMYPWEQLSDFDCEAMSLNKYLPGRQFRMGPADSDHVHIFCTNKMNFIPKEDITLEVLMHDLSPGIMKLFSDGLESYPGKKQTISGLEDFFQGMDTDSHMFSPFGFSLNGISGKNYYTIHVTPQPEGSYASFETNVPASDYSELMKKIMNIFQPKRFSLVLTTSKDMETLSLEKIMESSYNRYKCVAKSRYELGSGYKADFFNYQHNGG